MCMPSMPNIKKPPPPPPAPTDMATFLKIGGVAKKGRKSGTDLVKIDLAPGVGPNIPGA